MVGHLRYLIIMALMLVCCGTYAQESDDLLQDSLYNALCKEKNEHERLEIIHEIARTHNNLDSVEHYAKMEVRLAQKLHNAEKETMGYAYLGWYGLAVSDIPKAHEYIFRSISIADSIGDKSRVAYGYGLLGDSYMLTNDVNSANNCYEKSVELYTQAGKKESVAEVLLQMAQIDYQNLMYETAVECIDKALEIYKQLDMTTKIGRSFVIKGSVFFTKYRETIHSYPDPELLQKAKYYLLIGLEKIRENQHVYNTFLNTIINVYNNEAVIAHSPARRAELLDSAKIYLDESRVLSDKYAYGFPDDSYAEWLIASSKLDQAYAYLDTIFERHGNDYDYFVDSDYQLYHTYSHLLEKMGRYKESIRYKDLYYELKINGRQSDFIANASRSLAKSEFDQQLYEREVRYEADSKTRNMAIQSISIVAVMLMVLIFVVIRSYRRSRNINRLLDSQNNKLSAINKEMTDGINYASHIQKAALSSEVQLNNTFGEHLLIYKPLNIISGDFYWSTQIGHLKMLAVADSTGHGVPGALLSMLGISTLNEIATRVDENNPSAGAMLDDMRRDFMESLHQTGNIDESHDGIDIALIIIDTRSNIMHYAGAFRPVIIIRDGQCIKLDADRMPIGSHHNESENFTDHSFALQKGDVIYLYSDGMTDQFGYDEEGNIHKFTARRFTDMLLRIYKKPFPEQKRLIDDNFTQWRGNYGKNEELYEQTDDALIIGIMN